MSGNSLSDNTLFSQLSCHCWRHVRKISLGQHTLFSVVLPLFWGKSAKSLWQWSTAGLLCSTYLLQSLSAAFSNWGTTTNLKPCHKSRKPEAPEECCVWSINSGSDVKNAQVDYYDGAAVARALSHLCRMASQRSDGSNTLWWYFGPAVHTHHAPHHESKRKYQMTLMLLYTVSVQQIKFIRATLRRSWLENTSHTSFGSMGKF